MEDRKLYWLKENDLFSFRFKNEEKKRSTTTVHYPFFWLISIKVWDEIPVEENDKNERTPSSNVREREGGRADPFHWNSLRTDNFAYIIQVYINTSY